MTEEKAQVLDLMPKISSKKKDDAQEASKEEPVAVLASKIGQMLQDEGARPIHQLAALGVAGKAIRMTIATYHGEQVATKAVEKAFAISRQYEPVWANKPQPKSWSQMVFETGKCPLCDAPAVGPKPNGSFDILHLPECPLVPDLEDKSFIRPEAGTGDCAGCGTPTFGRLCAKCKGERG